MYGVGNINFGLVHIAPGGVSAGDANNGVSVDTSSGSGVVVLGNDDSDVTAPGQLLSNRSIVQNGFLLFFLDSAVGNLRQGTLSPNEIGFVDQTVSPQGGGGFSAMRMGVGRGNSVTGSLIEADTSSGGAIFTMYDKNTNAPTIAMQVFGSPVNRDAYIKNANGVLTFYEGAAFGNRLLLNMQTGLTSLNPAAGVTVIGLDAIGSYGQLSVNGDPTVRPQLLIGDVNVGDLNSLTVDLNIPLTTYEANSNPFFFSNVRGIGINVIPTQKLDIEASSGSNGTIPIRLRNGVLLATAVSGGIEMQSGFYFTKNSGLRVAGSGVIASFVTSVSNSGASETDLYSFTSPANTLAGISEQLTARFAGITDNVSVPNLKAYFAGTVLFDASLFTLGGVTGDWLVDVLIIRSGASTARAILNCSFFDNSGAGVDIVYTVQTDLTGLTFSNTNILKVTGQGAASNQITAKLGSVSWAGAPVL